MSTNQGITSSPTRHSRSIIQIIMIAAVLLSAIGPATAIQCFKCAVTVEKTYVKNSTIVTPMCSKFDKSNEYVVNCPFSTMCLKTISILHLQNGQNQETISRECAQQKDTTQFFRNQQWQQEYSVQEVYEEGCGEFKENKLAGSAKTHCYCRGDLCNVANSIRADSSTPIGLAVIFIFNTFKSVNFFSSY